MIVVYILLFVLLLPIAVFILTVIVIVLYSVCYIAMLYGSDFVERIMNKIT